MHNVSFHGINNTKKSCRSFTTRSFFSKTYFFIVVSIRSNVGRAYYKGRKSYFLKFELLTKSFSHNFIIVHKLRKDLKISLKVPTI